MNRRYPPGEEYWRSCPAPVRDFETTWPYVGLYKPQWNSVALFFNLPPSSPPSFTRPKDYKDTSPGDAASWFNGGDASMSFFLANYWSRLTYGNFGFGIETPVYTSGYPIVPTLPIKDPKDPTGNVIDPTNWKNLITRWIDFDSSYLQKIWVAAGKPMILRDSTFLGMKYKVKKFFIPSIILITNYDIGAAANVDNRFYEDDNYFIGHVTHEGYNLKMTSYPGMPTGMQMRDDLSTLCHEFSHNFLEFWDLYTPQGCTGYWDLLGNSCAPGHMSEVSSILKERIGWIEFEVKDVITGPTYPKKEFILQEYSRTGHAIKVVPDPDHNPSEYFVLEYRKSINDNPWVPDGGLGKNEGLLITHINERFGVAGWSWLLREAPFFDPEFADFSDKGGAQFSFHTNGFNGVLFPYGAKNAFTPSTKPSSDFYGPRFSGLSITNIKLHPAKPLGPEGTPIYPSLTFDLEINGNNRVGWNVSSRDRCASGKFTPDSKSQGKEIFCRNDTSAALLEHRQAQWFVRKRQDGKIDGWTLSSSDHEVVGDFDGDGLDEVYIRSPKYAGILKWNTSKSGFRAVTIQYETIDGWRLGSNDHELVGDFDSDGQDEIYIRSSTYAGIIKLLRGRLKLQSIQDTSIDKWVLSGTDKEVVGRFTQSKNDEILIRNTKGWGLLVWESVVVKGKVSSHGLRLHKEQHGRIDGWALDIENKVCVGDFDGDKRDEIYIRSSSYAGVLKWRAGRFHVLWMTENTLESLTDKDNSLTLSKEDRSYTGRFLVDRDGIFHQSNSSIGIVTLEGGKMIVRNSLPSLPKPPSLPKGVNGMWQVSTKHDNCIVGDYHNIGGIYDVDDPDPSRQTWAVTGGIDDVFMHNSWGTGMVGFNRPSAHPPAKHGSYEDQLGLTWMNKKEILFRIPPIAITKRP